MPLDGALPTLSGAVPSRPLEQAYLEGGERGGEEHITHVQREELIQ
jgi:hypothetical protein